MNSTSKTVARNAGVLMISQVMTWGLSLLLTTAMSRTLGAQAMGKFYLASSLWGIISIFATFGMDLMLVKEIARYPEKTPGLMGTSIYLRTGLFALGAVVILGYSRLVGYPQDTLEIILLIGLANLILQYVQVGEIGLKGLERMEFVSFGSIASKVFATLVTLIILWMGYGIKTAALVIIGAAVVNLVVILFALRRVTSIHLTFYLDEVRKILKMCLPYLAVNVVMNFYSQVDIVVISLLVNEQNVGWYGQAAQLFGTFLFIPLVFNTAVYPSLARLFSKEPDALNKVMRKSFELMLLMGVPVGLGVFVIARKLVLILFGGGFYGSGWVLGLMGIVLTITYQNMLLGRYYMAIDRQKQYTIILAVALALTIPIDVIIIPWLATHYGNGAIGGSISYIITESVVLSSSIVLLPKGVLDRKTLITTIKTVAAGLVMVAATWWMQPLFIGVPIAVGAVVYLTMIVLLRAVPAEDWRLLKSIAGSLMSRINRRVARPVEYPGEKPL